MSAIVGIIGGIFTFCGVLVSAWFSLRSSRAAAAITAAAQEHVAATQTGPAQTQAGLEVLQVTLTRVDRENADMRARVSRVEAVMRAFARTVDRLTAQVRHAGLEPEPNDPLVDEYYRTGV